MGLDDYIDSFAEVIVGGEGNVLERTGQVFQKSLSMATLMGPIGDTFETAAAFTGVDQFTGAQLSGLERWLSALGIGAFGGGVVGGAAMAGMGFPSSLLLARGRAQPRQGFFDMSQGGRVVKNPNFDVGLSRLNDMEGVRNPDHIFMSTTQTTNDILRLDFDDVQPKVVGGLPQSRGWNKMATDVIAGYRADGELPTWHPDYEPVLAGPVEPGKIAVGEGTRRARVMGRLRTMAPDEDVWVFHGTTPDAADSILAGTKPNDQLSVALSPYDASRYGPEVVAFKVKRSELTENELGFLAEGGGGLINQSVDMTTAEVITRNAGMTKAEAQVAGFLEGVYAPMLMERLASSQAMMARVAQTGSSIDNPEMAVAAFALAQWEFATGWAQVNFKNDFFQGSVAPMVLEEWAKLKRGEAANTELLGEYMTRFAVATDWIQDPELRINPTTWVNHVNLDSEIPQVGLKVARWRQAPIEMLSAQAAQGRLQYMMLQHPAAFVQLMSENLEALLQNAMAKPPDMEWDDWWTDLRHMPSAIEPVDDITEMIRSWRNWYTGAKERMVAATGELSGKIDPGVLRHARDETSMTTYMTVVAAVLSGGEDWDSNVPKAVTMVDKIYNYSGRRRTVAELHEMLTTGDDAIKISVEDLVKILLLEGVDDPMEVFTRGTKGGRKLESLAGHIDRQDLDYAELLDMKKMTEAYESQKQDSFAYAILRSEEADIEERQAYMALMMAGEMGGTWERNLSGAVVQSQGANLREKLALVADRQHFKASLGFSLVPDTWLSSRPGAYDQFAQAARIAAAKIGEVDGQVLTPEELQAITWMRWRAMSRYTDPQGTNWPNATDAERWQRLLKRLDKGESIDSIRAEVAPLDTQISQLNAEIAKLRDDRAPKAEIKKLVDARDRVRTKRRKLPDRIEIPDEVDNLMEGDRIAVPSRAQVAKDLEITAQKQQMPATAGMLRPSSATASYNLGQGPTLRLSNTVMKYITGEMQTDLPSTRYVDAGTDPTRYRMDVDDLGPVDYGRELPGSTAKNPKYALSPGDEIEELVFEIAPDGTAKIMAPPGSTRRQGEKYLASLTSVRGGKYFSPAMHNGQQVLRSQRPVQVRSAPDWFNRVAATTVQTADPAMPGITGSRLFGRFDERTPAFNEGPQLAVSAMLPHGKINDPMKSQWGATTAETHQRFAAAFERAGIEFTYEDLDSHQGSSVIYTEVGKVGDTLDDDALEGQWHTWDVAEAMNHFKVDNADALTPYMRGHKEPRQERVWRFANEAELQRAIAVLRSGETTTPVAQAARDYMTMHRPGVPFRRPDADRTRMSAWLGKAHHEVAKWYEEIPTFSTAEEYAAFYGPEEWKRITDAYDAMIAETEQQYQYLVSLGYRMDITVDDPYPTPAAMAADLDDVRPDGTRHLRIFATQPGDHPYLTPEQNDKLRFVHDVFGHMTHEADFSRFDEDVAFLTHAQMYSDKARPALYSELRSQTAALVARRESGQTWIWTPDGNGIEFGDHFISGDTAADIAMALGENPSVENIADTLKASIDQYLPPGAPERDWTRADLESMAGQIVQAHDFSLFADQKMGLMPTNLQRMYRPRYETMERSLLQKLTKDEVADARAYFDHPGHAPEGLVGGWEHHVVDEQGAHVATMSSSGGPHRSNTRQVWLLDDDLGPYAFSAQSGALDPGGSAPRTHAEGWWDNQIRIEEGDGNYALGKSEGNTIWDQELLTRGDDGEMGSSGKVKEFWLMVPDADGTTAPVMTLDEAQARMWPADRTVKVTKGRAKSRGSTAGEKSFVLWQVNGKKFRKADPMLFQDVQEVLFNSNDVAPSGTTVAFGGSRYTGGKS